MGCHLTLMSGQVLAVHAWAGLAYVGHGHAYMTDRYRHRLGGHKAKINVSAPEPRGPIHLFGPLDQTIEILPIDATGAESVEVVVVFALDNLQQPRRRFAR